MAAQLRAAAAEATLESGWDSASATTLDIPGILTSWVVYSEMRARWHCWWLDAGGDTLVRTHNSGLWSVHSRNCLPSSWERKCGKQFSVEGGIVYLCFGELLAEETQWLPVLADLLLEDHQDMGIGGVCGEGEACVRPWVGQGNGCDQGCLGGGESGGHVGQPGESFGVTCEHSCERLEGPCYPREETAVEIGHT